MKKNHNASFVAQVTKTQEINHGWRGLTWIENEEYKLCTSDCLAYFSSFLVFSAALSGEGVGATSAGW